MNDNLQRAVDAFSASPAIRLRYRSFIAKPVQLAYVSLPELEPLADQSPRWEPLDTFAGAPVDHRASLGQLVRLRQQAADEIEWLIAFLDASEDAVGEDIIDDDEDTNGDDLEPSLGAFENLHHGAAWEVDPTNASCFVDAELNTCDDEPGGDDEPDLGWTRTGALGNTRDLEIGQVAP